MFYSSEDVPVAFLFASPITESPSPFQSWVALQLGLYNRSICLIYRMKIWHKTELIKDLLHAGNEWSTQDTMAHGAESHMFLEAPRIVYTLVKKAPGDDKKIAKSTSFLSWKK